MCEGGGSGMPGLSTPLLEGRGLRDVWAGDAICVVLGAETFASEAALEGGGTETDCTSDATYVYPYEEMRGVWFSYALSALCLLCVML